MVGREICLKNFWDLVIDFRTWGYLHIEFYTANSKQKSAIFQLLSWHNCSCLFEFLTPKELYRLHLPIWETHVYGLKSQTKQQTEAFWSIYSLSGGYYQHQLAIYLPPLVGFRKEFRYRLQVTILTLSPRVVDRCCRVEAMFFFLGKRCFQCWVLNKLGGHCCEIFQIFKVWPLWPLLVFILIFFDLWTLN